MNIQTICINDKNANLEFYNFRYIISQKSLIRNEYIFQYKNNIIFPFPKKWARSLEILLNIPYKGIKNDSRS